MNAKCLGVVATALGGLFGLDEPVSAQSWTLTSAPITNYWSAVASSADGRKLVLATASYRLYAAAIAHRLGFDDVIATETQIDDQGWTIERIDGENCYGAAKLAMIQAWLAREGLDRDAVHIRFYSDHISDAPVHHWSDEAFATNPHDRLVKLAEVEGWKVLDWRKE